MFDRINKVFGKKNFKGQGHRLGSADDPKEPKSAAERRKGQAAASGRRQNEPNSTPTPARNPNAFAGRPQRLGNVASSQPAHPRQEKPDSPGKPLPGSPEGSSTGQSLTTSSPIQPPVEEAAAVKTTEAVSAALALLKAGPEEPRAVLQKLLANIVREPAEIKFRKIRLGNPKIQAAVVDADGGLELLQACGFHVDVVEASGDSPADAFAVLPEEAELDQIKAALSLLGYKVPAAPQPPPREASARRAEPASSRPVSNSEPCDRETQVLLPSAPEGREDVPDWVFKRTPAELKAAMQEARRKREQGEMLMTRAMREKMAHLRVSAPECSKATVRVRLPEGLLLQGKFNPDEPVAAVFDWVTDSLAEPGTTYELVLPDRKPLVTSMGTLRSAQLLPNVLLMLRCTDRPGSQQLTIRSELMLASVQR